MNHKPYTEKLRNEKIIRKFDVKVNENELVWHRDRHDRIVRVLHGENWYIQFDNQLPVKLEQNKSYQIPAGLFHRVIKGSDDLIIEIHELVNKNIQKE